MTRNTSGVDRDETAPVVAFLRDAQSTTGDTLERTAVAEAEGFTDADARAAGWDDLFAVAEDVSGPPLVHGDHEQRIPLRALGLLSFARGVVYILPVGPISVLWSEGRTSGELALMWITVVLAWGLGMAVSFSVGSIRSREPGQEVLALRQIMLASVGLGVLVALLVAALPGMDIEAGVIAALQFVYVIAANCLLAMGRPALLAATLAPGVAATVWFWLLPALGPVQFAVGLAGAALVLPVLAALWCTRGPLTLDRTWRGVDSLTAGQFAVYGFSSAVIVLWMPLAAPGAASVWLGIALLVCLPVMELIVAACRVRNMNMLQGETDLRSFERATYTTIALGGAGYAVLLLLTLSFTSLLLVRDGHSVDSVLVPAVGFFLVGVSQLLGSLCLCYHEIPTAAAAMGVGIVALVAVPAAVRAALGLEASSTHLFFAFLVLLVLVLTRALRRGLRTPMRHV